MNDKKETASLKRRQFILRIFVIVLISFFLGLTVYTINAKRVLHNLLPMPFGVGTAVVLSGSMEPTLSVNDLVFVEAAPDYQTGDIVVYQSSQELIIHRIVAVDGEAFITRGDANNTEDPPIEASVIKGKLVFVIPFIGLLIRGLQTLPGILIVLVIAFLLLRMSWRKEKDASRQEQDTIKDEIRRLKSQLEQNDKPAESDAASGQADAK